MLNKDLFIQNINDTTTVLQQLRVCIEQMKENIDYCNETKDIVDEDINTLEEYINSIHLYNIILGTASSKAFLQLDLLYKGELSFDSITDLVEFLMTLPNHSYYNATGSVKLHQLSGTTYDVMGIVQRIQILSNGIDMHGIALQPNSYSLFDGQSFNTNNISDYFGSDFTITKLM